MKVFVGVILLLSGFCFGQFFEENDEFFNSYFDSETQYFQYEKSVNYSERIINKEYTEPDLGEDALTNPNPEVPISSYYYLLVISAVFCGIYYFHQKQKSSQTPC
jgi:hypothetical protein